MLGSLQDEYERTTLNCYFRSEEELLRPFMTNTPVYNAGLRLTSSTWEFISEAHLHKRIDFIPVFEDDGVLCQYALAVI